MVIEVNDMFRLVRTSNYWNPALWHLEQWQPPDWDHPRARWRAITTPVRPDAMDALLQRMDCPGDALAAFRAA